MTRKQAIKPAMQVSDQRTVLGEASFK